MCAMRLEGLKIAGLEERVGHSVTPPYPQQDLKLMTTVNGSPVLGSCTAIRGLWGSWPGSAGGPLCSEDHCLVAQVFPAFFLK